MTACQSEQVVCEKVVDQDHFFVHILKMNDRILKIARKDVYEIEKTIDLAYLKAVDDYFKEDDRYFRKGYSISFFEEMMIDDHYSALFTIYDLKQKGYECETTRKS